MMFLVASEHPFMGSLDPCFLFLVALTVFFGGIVVMAFFRRRK